MQSEIAKEDWVGLAPGDVVGETYRVDRIIGRGGNGLVAEAVRREDGQKVAIKVMRPDPDGDGEAVTRFLFEAKAASQMKSVHIAKVLEVGSLLGGEPYFVMEFLEGHDLDAALRGEGLVSVETACDYVLQTCEALAEAHAGGIVHGDIKPRNLFLTLTPGGTILVKLLDFGISKHAPADMTTDMRTTKTHWPVMGTPLYMAPEQMRSTRRVDHRADIWALGIVLHECVTGQMPFVGASLSEMAAAVAADAPVKCRAQRPDLPEEVEAIILRCLEKDPESRFANVAELASALLPFGPPNAALTEKRISTVLSAATRVTAPPPPRRSMFPAMPTPFMPIVPTGLPSVAPPPPPTDEVDAGWNEDAAPAVAAAPHAGEAPPAPEQVEPAPAVARVGDAEPPPVAVAPDPPVEKPVPASEAETPFVPPVEEAPAVAARTEEMPGSPEEDVPPPRVRVVSVAPSALVPVFEAPPSKKQGPGVWIGLAVVAAVAAAAFFLTRPAEPPPVAAPQPAPLVTAAPTVSPPPPAVVASEAPRPPTPPPPPAASTEPSHTPWPSAAASVDKSETTPKSERTEKEPSHGSSRSGGRHEHEHQATKTTSTTPAPAGTAAFGGSRE